MVLPVCNVSRICRWKGKEFRVDYRPWLDCSSSWHSLPRSVCRNTKVSLRYSVSEMRLCNHTGQESPRPHAYPYAGETVRLWKVREKFRDKVLSYHTLQNTYWRETLLMWFSRECFYVFVWENTENSDTRKIAVIILKWATSRENLSAGIATS